MIKIRVGHADIFADTNRCEYPHYPAYVGYRAIHAAHILDRHGMAIPNKNIDDNNECWSVLAESCLYANLTKTLRW